MTTELSDDQVAQAIREAITENPDREYGSEGEFASSLGLGVSVSRVKRVLRRMIRKREVYLERDPREHIDSYVERPITFGVCAERSVR